MSIIPLRYLSSTVTAGKSRTQADASSAAFSQSQVAVRLGEPVPIVFCRQTSNNGGVLVRPKASEARFNGNTSITPNALEVYYVLVLSEGELPSVQIRDCWVGSCRRGTWNQSYSRRPGSWLPGRFGAELAPVPEHCGTGGSYQGMTTISFFESYLEFSKWSLQTSVFVREGMKVTRLIDSTLGPSNNFADLVVYLMKQSGEIPDALIDIAQMTKAANFVNANSLFFNGRLEKPANLIDWIKNTATGFLLKLVKKNGKLGLTPLVQHATDYTFSDKKVNWLYTFLDKHLVIDGIDISYVSAEDRKPIQFEVLWRQQPDDDIGYIRSTLVKMEGATDRVQTLDLSAFCTSELHATKVAAYNVAIRKYVSHYATIRLRPGDYSTHLIVGDIVRVRLANETKQGPQHAHDFLYQIQSIQGNLDGTTVMDLMHYPLNQSGQSLLTLGVKNATSPGSVYTLIRKSISCDDVLPTDTTVLTDVGLDFSSMLSDANWDVFDSVDLSFELDDLDFEFDQNFYEGPLPINDDGLEVNVTASQIQLGLTDIVAIDADSAFDPNTQTIADFNKLDVYIDGINPESVVSELQPTHNRCGLNTGLDREDEIIPKLKLDEDGNPSSEDGLQPFWLPWENWPNINQTPNSLNATDLFDTELTNPKNAAGLAYVNTSTFLTLTDEQCPWGDTGTSIDYYRLENDGSKTFIGRKLHNTFRSYNDNYPQGDGGYTFAPLDVGKEIEVRLVNTNNVSESVYYATLPACQESVLSYDWLQVEFGKFYTSTDNVQWRSRYRTGSNTALEGIFPKFAKTAISKDRAGEGRMSFLYNPGFQEPTVSGVMINSIYDSITDANAWFVFNLNAIKIAFPEMPNIVFKIYPLFQSSTSYADPTTFAFTKTATFYKGGWQGYGTTARPITATNEVISTTETYSVTSVTPSQSSFVNLITTTAPADLTVTVDLQNYSVSIT